MARIIIADDDELVIDVARAALEARGHVVGALSDGVRVREVVQRKQPDLVILDCSMPHVSGIEALRQMRNTAAGYKMPVLVLTARCSSVDEEIAVRAGADEYLRKPVDPDRLVASVEMLLEGRKPRVTAGGRVDPHHY